MDIGYHLSKREACRFMSKVKNKVADCIFTAMILVGIFLLNLLLQNRFKTQTVTPMLFLLGVFLVSWRTQGYFWGVAASLLSVLAVNWALVTVCRMCRNDEKRLFTKSLLKVTFCYCKLRAALV